MLKETSGYAISLIADTNAKWNSELSGQIIHCAQGPAVQKGRRMSSLIDVPELSSASPTAVMQLLMTALGSRLVLGTRSSAIWVGKHSSQWPCTQGEESGSTALSHGQPAMVEDGGVMDSVMPAGAHLQFPEFDTPAGGGLFPEPVPSFPTAWFCLCHWKILNQFWLTALCCLKA